MADNVLKARMRQKCDTTENWAKAAAFIPMQGELIVYSDTRKMKIGDGVTALANLEYIEGGKVDDVKVNGASVVSDKVANITIPTFYSGTNLPDDAIGKNGDIYIMYSED